MAQYENLVLNIKCIVINIYCPQENYLETVVIGSWMAKWEIVNKNRYVEAFLKEKRKGQIL